MSERDACPIDMPKGSLNIGLVAYQCLPGMVFVRVPNERARYMLVDRCVADHGCPTCGAIANEPCKSNKFGVTYGFQTRLVYVVQVHLTRRQWRVRAPDTAPKPVLRAADLEAASESLPEDVA